MLSILSSSYSFAGPASFAGRASITMQATTTLNGKPGTPGGAEFAKTLPGVVAPLGYFDPAGIVGDCAQEEILRFREAELTHGRVAMMAALGFIVQEAFHPLFSFADGPAAHQLDTVLTTPAGQTGGFVLLLAIFMSELTRAKTGWEDPDVLPFALRKDYTPGDVGFDPLGLKPTVQSELLAMQNKEINNGRLAMLAVAGFVAQECITDQAIF